MNAPQLRTLALSVLRPLRHTAAPSALLRAPSTSSAFHTTTRAFSLLSLAPRMPRANSVLGRNGGLGSDILVMALPVMQQVRCMSRGNEYQPSQRVRKRRHGFLARKRSKGGRAILARRKHKGRFNLSH